MWYYDSQIISRPKTMVISNITYPKAIFRNSSQLTELGIKPYREIRQDSRYFWDGAYSVDTSGDEVVGTYAGTARDVATLKAGMLSKTNSHVASLHAAIDWYWSRAAKGGTSVPSNIATYATALYSEHETKKTEIAALNNIAKIKELNPEIDIKKSFTLVIGNIDNVNVDYAGKNINLVDSANEQKVSTTTFKNE